MGPSPHFGGNPDEGIHQPSYSRTVANRHRLWRRALALRFADPKVWMSLRYMPRWPPAAIKSSESTLPLCRGCQRVARGANGAADEAEAVGWKRKPIRAGGGGRLPGPLSHPWPPLGRHGAAARAVDMMDNARALPTFPQPQQQQQTDFLAA